MKARAGYLLIRVRVSGFAGQSGRGSPPVVLQQPETNADERQHQVQAEQMSVRQFCAASRKTKSDEAGLINVLRAEEEGHVEGEVQDVVQGDGQGDDECLADFYAVDAGENVDTVGAKGREH